MPAANYVANIAGKKGGDPIHAVIVSAATQPIDLDLGKVVSCVEAWECARDRQCAWN
jgi:hypothetical protein